MIKLTRLFKPVSSMTPDEAKVYMKTRKEGAFTLLDVRQPKEYEQTHLAGSKLIPLPQLDERISEIDPQKPTIVYCAVGGRSRVAAQFLSGRGFNEVYNLKGGIEAWMGFKAAGPTELNLDLIKGDETAPEIVAVAYELEGGLGQFYARATERAGDREVADLLAKLSRIEGRHQAALLDLYQALDPQARGERKIDSGGLSGRMEGGFDVASFLEENDAMFKRTVDVLNLAMMLETQAMDLYLRMADKSTDPEARQIFFKIATEEKAHLAALGEMYEQKF